MARAAWKQLRNDLLENLCSEAPAISKLSLVQRTDTALQRIEVAEKELRKAFRPGVDAFQQAKLASILDLKGQHREALELLQRLATEPVEKGQRAAMSLLEHLVSRHVTWEQERARAKPGQKAIPVEILSEKVSGEEVRQRFIEPGLPCVLRGVQLVPFQNLRDLTATVGPVKIPLRRCDESSTSWARLEMDGLVPFDDFVKECIEPYQDQQAPRNSPQLFDFSIWQQCEGLGNQISMPSQWFPVDLYSYASKQMQPISGSAAPTLFVAPCGSGSSLHVDTLQTNFWMFMCLGRKRWRLVSRDEVALLHPQYLCDLNPVFPADLNVADLCSVTVHETVLEPGDLIFVPAGWPHQVDNLETSVAISANFIDSSNVNRCIEEAEIMGTVEENPALWAKILRTAVHSEVPQRLAAAALRNESLRAFKARHGEAWAPYEIQRRLLQGLSMTLGIGGVCCLWVAWRWSFARERSLERSLDFKAKTL